MNYYKFYFILLFLCALQVNTAFSQSWEFVKEKDGVQIYSRKTAGKQLKSFKAIAEINAPVEKIFNLLENVNNTDWWDKNVTQIKVLLYEKNKTARYYMVYKLPWPVKSRDLCVNSTVEIDSETGIYKLTAVPLLGGVAEHDNLVRIKDYQQIWTVRATGRNQAHVELESYVDPGGSVPNWLYNLLLIDSPANSINGLKLQMQKN